MKRIKSIIIDDEISAVHTLRGMLDEFCPMVNVVQAVNNIEQAVQAVKHYHPEVVFLDIEMPPNGTGFDFLRQTEDLSYGVIFTTAYAHYAIQAINEAQPWAYLVKPYKSAELVQAIHNATVKLTKPAPSSDHAYRGIALGDMRKGNVVIRFNELIYCQAEGPCTNFYYLQNGKLERHVAYKSLKDIEKEVPDTLFCRVHHSYLINMAHVRRFERIGRTGKVYLPDETPIDVSAQKLELFHQHFSQFLRGYETR